MYSHKEAGCIPLKPAIHHNRSFDQGMALPGLSILLQELMMSGSDMFFLFSRKAYCMSNAINVCNFHLPPYHFERIPVMGEIHRPLSWEVCHAYLFY
jgi:hypothetical protein